MKYIERLLMVDMVAITDMEDNIINYIKRVILRGCYEK